MIVALTYGSSIVAITLGTGSFEGLSIVIDGAVGTYDAKDHRGRRRDQVEPVVALEPLLDDLHVQQSEEPAAESETERDRALRLVDERGVVELELLERVAQPVVLALVRIKPAVDHRDGLAVAGECNVRGIGRRRDRIADVDFAERLNIRDDVADVSKFERARCAHLRREDADFGTLENALVGHRQKSRPGRKGPVHDSQVADDAAIRIELSVEDQRAQMIAVSLWRRNALDDRLQDGFDTDPVLGAGENAFALLHHEQFFDLAHDALGIGGRQVDLIDDRDDREFVLERQVVV